jgi:hypothetical protein
MYMSRSRTYTFIIKTKDYETAWIYLSSLDHEFEYMCMNIKRHTISGFARFKNAKSLSAVQKTLHYDAKIDEELKTDTEMRAELYSKRRFFECGTPSKRIRPLDLELNCTETELLDKLVNGQLMLANLLIDRDKQLIDICKTVALSAPIQPSVINCYNNNTNNTINNKVSFNLNMFLNEKCKDAMDITNFARSIPIGLDDIMLFKNFGHAEAITRIIDKAYRDMELTKRPMHCTDAKRETLYVKNEDQWTNDESKAIIEKAISIVASHSFSNLKQWKDANPDYNEDEDKKTEYARIMRQLLGGLTDREIEENTNKIVRNVTRIAQLDKEQAALL